MTITDDALECFLKKHREMAAAGDWGIYPDDRKAINQAFADRHDWDGLESFYTQAILRADPAFSFGCLPIQGDGFPPFAEKLCHAIHDSLGRRMEEAKAIYIEYGTGTCDVFLCTRYSKATDDWAAAYDLKTAVAIDYPEALLYFWDDAAPILIMALVERYLDARLLACIGRCVDAVPSRSLPVCMAASDLDIVHISPSDHARSTPGAEVD